MRLSKAGLERRLLSCTPHIGHLLVYWLEVISIVPCYLLPIIPMGKLAMCATATEWHFLGEII